MAGLASQTRRALPSALVLDLDGVVADTEPASIATIAQTYAAVGVTLEQQELRARRRGVVSSGSHPDAPRSFTSR
jgi:beta-phosphoglucomutase-like phosphatase (HAD superfamily)